MPRARNIKPGFFTNDLLAELPFETRLLFIGLWTVADREGRLEDRPKKIKMEVFPADDVNVDDALWQLVHSGFIRRYTHENTHIIQVINFTVHQRPHSNEAASTLVAYEESTSNDAVLHGTANHGEQPCSPRRQPLRPDTGYLNDDPGYLKPSPPARPAHGRGAHYPEDFETFWAQYPNKKGKDRALKVWMRLRPSPELLATILAAIARQRTGRDWIKDDGQYIPHPATWLNDAGWLNEVSAPTEDRSKLTITERNMQNGEKARLLLRQMQGEPSENGVYETKGMVVR